MDTRFLTDPAAGLLKIFAAAPCDAGKPAGGERSERRQYLLPASALQQTLVGLVADFDVVEVDGERVQAHEVAYFDDAGLGAYYARARGRKRRWQVRMRRTATAPRCRVDIRLSDAHGLTVRKKLDCAADEFGRLGKPALGQFSRSWRKLFGELFDARLQLAMTLRWQRISLLAKARGAACSERIRIDSALQFERGDRACRSSTQMLIVEVESAAGKGRADAVLCVAGARLQARCSRYCLGMAALGAVSGYNRFLPMLRKLGLLPQAAVAASAPARPVAAEHSAAALASRPASRLRLAILAAQAAAASIVGGVAFA